MRKRLAGHLRRWAYRIDPPRSAVGSLVEAVYSTLADAIAKENESRGRN